MYMDIVLKEPTDKMMHSAVSKCNNLTISSGESFQYYVTGQREELERFLRVLLKPKFAKAFKFSENHQSLTFDVQKLYLQGVVTSRSGDKLYYSDYLPDITMNGNDIEMCLCQALTDIGLEWDKEFVKLDTILDEHENPVLFVNLLCDDLETAKAIKKSWDNVIKARYSTYIECFVNPLKINGCYSLRGYIKLC